MVPQAPSSTTIRWSSRSLSDDVTWPPPSDSEAPLTRELQAERGGREPVAAPLDLGSEGTLRRGRAADPDDGLPDGVRQRLDGRTGGRCRFRRRFARHLRRRGQTRLRADRPVRGWRVPPRGAVPVPGG